MDTETIVIDESELSLYCRACLKRPEEIVDLEAIYDQEDQLSYNNCFTICTKIDLSKENNLPHNLCKLCGLELQMAYDFHKKVVNATRQLKELFRNSSFVVISDEDNAQSESTLAHKTKNIKETESQLPDSETADFEVDQLEEHLEIEEFHSGESADEDEETIQIRIETETGEQEYVLKHRDLKNISKKGNEEKVQLMHGKTIGEISKTASLTGDDAISFYSDSENSDTVKKKSATPKKGKRNHNVGKFKCRHCDKMFPHYSRMLIHQRLHEPDRPTYPCSDCGRIYATKQALDVHFRSAHSKNGYSCNVCGKMYGIKKSLEIHMRYHTGDFPYKCDECGKKFAQIGHLNTHKKVKHNSARFCCSYPNCEKNFTSSASLRNHEFSHSSMPFECEFCQRGYPAKAKLKVHIKNAHGKELTLEEMEPMRKFYVMRSKLNLVKLEKNQE